MKVAERLKEKIEDKGITYTKISEKTGIPLQVISNIFLGKRKLTADELFSICRATEIDIDTLRPSALVIPRTPAS